MAAWLLLVRILLLAGFLQSFVGDSPAWLIRHYTVEDGLPVNSVTGITQGDKGYLYFSTYDGLVRYDGYTFRIYNSGNTRGMESNAIVGMLKTKGNKIWMIHTDGSLTLKEGSIFRTFRAPQIADKVFRIIETHGGEVWISTSSGIARYDEQAKTFVRVTDPALAFSTPTMGTMGDDVILALNKKGLYSWNGHKAELLIPSSDFPIPIDGVMQIKALKKGTFWVVGQKGAFRFSLKQKHITYRFIPKKKNFKFWNITQKKNGNIVFTGLDGFYIFDPASETTKKKPIPIYSSLDRSNLIFEDAHGKDVWIGNDEVTIDGAKVFEAPGISTGFLDREGSIWLATQARGIYQIRKSHITNITPRDIPGLTNVYPIIESRDGAIWAGSYQNGIYRIKGNGYRRWNTSNSSLKNNIVRYLYEDTDGTLYAGLNDEGLWAFKNGDWKPLKGFKKLISRYNQPTIEAMYRKGNRLFIGSYGSLVVREHGRFKLFDATKPKALQGVRVIRENHAGILFMGTFDHGLTRMDDGMIQSYNVDNKALKSNSVRDIFLQSDDTLWVATQNLGLDRLILNQAGKLLSSVSVTKADGLISNSLHRIIEDDFGYLWISSNAGIMRISKTALNHYADGSRSELPMLIFNKRDGMVNREANGGVQSAGLLASDGKIWFPNQQGITLFNPDDFTARKAMATPLPVIQSITLSDTVIYISNKHNITLPESKRNFRIAFSAPNFKYQDRINFHYKMEGVATGWQVANQSRQAVFTTITPGKHVFTVQTSLANGMPVQKSITIVIPKLFYETTWFYLLLIFGGLCLITVGYRIRVRSLREREKKLQLRVDKQTEALKKADEQKSRFFTGITHELKTPLSLIVGPLDDLADDSGDLASGKINNRISMMRRNAKRLQFLVDQILDVSKLHADASVLTLQPVDIVRRTRQIAGQFSSRLEQQELSLEIKADSIKEYIYVDNDAWERILINVLTNAIKFSPKKGTIYLCIKDEGSYVTLSIEDQGPGIAPENQQQVFEYLYQVEGEQASEGTGIGLYLVKGLVEHMGGSIILTSGEGEGAIFVITLQKGHRHFAPVHTIKHQPLVSDKAGASEVIAKVVDQPIEKEGEWEAQVLIVEDNYDFRSYLHSILRSRYQVLQVANGKEALEMLQHEHPDIIISDIMMPEMNGLEFVNSLRKNKAFTYLPVIFLSAKNRDADIETGLSTGADIYLAKPIRSNLLLTQIAAVLRRERVLSNEPFADKRKHEPDFKRQVRQIVYRQMGNSSLSINMLADALYISRAKLYLEWKKVSDMSPNDFIKKIRLEEACILLKERGFNVQETARAVGYHDPAYFSTSFKKEFGFSPSELMS